MEVSLTMSKTNISVHETAIISYVKKISILYFHPIGDFTLFATIIENYFEFVARLCFTVFVPAVMLGQI